MPTFYEINTEHGVVFSRGTGVYRYADHLAHMEKLARDPDFDPGYNQLIDCRGFAEMELKAKQIEDLARQTIFRDGSRHAFVASSDSHFGLTRMFGSFRELNSKQEVRVFRGMREALVWLNLPLSLESEVSGSTAEAPGNSRTIDAASPE